MFVFFSETDVERTGLIELNVSSGLVFQRANKGGIRIAAGTRELEELVRSIRLNLRRQNAAGGPRCFFAEFTAFDHGHVAHAAQNEFTRDRQSDNAAADNRDIGARFSICRLIASHSDARLSVAIQTFILV